MKVGVWGGDIPFYRKKDIDIFKQLEHLRNLKVNIYCHIIHTSTDFYKLEKILETLERPHWKDLANLEIWPVLLPPTEGGSEPHEYLWNRWAKVFKNLRMMFPRLSAVVIDDFNCFRPNLKFFDDPMDNLRIWETEWQCEHFNGFYDILSSAEMKFYPVIYETKLLVEEDRFQAFVDFVKNWFGHNFRFDGMIVPWMNLCSSEGLLESLKRVKKNFPQKTLIGMIYASSTSWHLYPPPLKAYVDSNAALNFAPIDAIVNYCVPSQGVIFEATKKLFGEWTKCA